MGCDMVVALGTATNHGQAFFAANSHRPRSERQRLCHVPGRTYALGESTKTSFLTVPQVRQTHAVLATQAVGEWGYLQGMNEHRLAVGVADWQSRLKRDQPGLLGADLVRLTLERAHSARQALEVLTDLIVRYGQGWFEGSPETGGGDHVFLLADPCEAFAVEAAGLAWAAQEIGQARAASDQAIIRQDWYRLAPGLAGRAIAEGWWPEDGSKLDFVGSLSENPAGSNSALRRWGRATLLIEQQNGKVDSALLRRMLADRYEGTRYEVDPLEGPGTVTPICQHAVHGATNHTAISGVAQLPAAQAATAVYWVAFGPPDVAVHFPVIFEGELPTAFDGTVSNRMADYLDFLGTNASRWLAGQDNFARLQARFEVDVEEFLIEAAKLKSRGEVEEMRHAATAMMQHHVEQFEELLHGLLVAAGSESAELAGMADF